MLWGSLDPETFQASSINGLGHLSPSCNDCGGDADGAHTVRVPISSVKAGRPCVPWRVPIEFHLEASLAARRSH